MVIDLPADLQNALVGQAERLGLAPETLALDLLRRQLKPAVPFIPQDDWERQLLAIGVPCGVFVSDEALSRDGLYD